MYNILVRAILYYNNRDRDIRKKMSARGLPPSHPVTTLYSQFQLINPSMLVQARYYQMALLHNAGATGVRNRRFLGSPRKVSK